MQNGVSRAFTGVLVAAGAFLFGATPSPAQQAGSPQFLTLVGHDVSRPLRDIVPVEREPRAWQLVGADALPDEDLVTLEVARMLRETFLQQHAYDPVDAALKC